MHANLSARYTGDFVDSKRDGRGVEHADDGVYTGEFADDARSGHGTLKGPEKDVYCGQWDAGLRSGKGSLVFGNGNGKYEGAWMFDRPEGHGVRVWPTDDTFEGSFFCGTMFRWVIRPLTSSRAYAWGRVCTVA